MKLLISRQLKITVLGAVKFLLNVHLWLKKGQLAGVIGHRHFQPIQEWERWLYLHPENQHLCLGCTSLNKCEILQQFQFRTWSSQKINPEEKKKGRGGWKISFLLGADPVFGLKGVWDWKLWLSARPCHLKTTISQKYYNARNEMQNKPRNIIAPSRQVNDGTSFGIRSTTLITAYERWHCTRSFREGDADYSETRGQKGVVF